MTHINLYTYSSLKCIKAAYPAHAAAGFILEFPTEKGDVTLTQTHLLEKLHNIVPEMTGNYSELFIFGTALSRIKGTVELDFYTESVYLANALGGWLDQWKENDWKASTGKDIAYQADWKTVAALMEPHTVTVHLKEPHKYRSWLKHEVESERRFVKD